EREEIGARIRLAVALPERRFAARDGRQDLATQSLGAVLDDRVRGLPRARERAERRAGERQLFEQHELEEHWLRPAAERRGPAHADPSALAQRLHERTRVRPGAVSRIHAIERKRVEGTFYQERAHVVGEDMLGGAESEVHGRLCCRVTRRDASEYTAG